MKIGDYDVSNFTRNSVLVGCQRVSRQEVEEVLRKMDEVSEPEIVIGPKGLELEQHKGYVVLRFNKWNILTIDKSGLHLVGCVNPYCGLPVQGDKVAITL